MRFFFHLHNGHDAIDHEGEELNDLATALERGCFHARQMAAESVREGHLNLQHYVAVADASGEIVERCTFGDVVQITL